MSVWTYYVPTIGETDGAVSGVRHAPPSYNAEDVAEIAAWQCYESEDGWEWMPKAPSEFVILKDHEEEGRFIIEVEFEPTFAVTPKEASNE